ALIGYFISPAPTLASPLRQPAYVRMTRFHRSLEESIKPILQAGFRLNSILEPGPRTARKLRSAGRRVADENKTLPITPRFNTYLTSALYDVQARAVEP
ncbi:MAG: hypothetical protein LC800_21785, partial [Acidobacteria bacterium]|nr:hypothetical protein [Acidobacteriota bacterium]